MCKLHKSMKYKKFENIYVNIVFIQSNIGLMYTSLNNIVPRIIKSFKIFL